MKNKGKVSKLKAEGEYEKYRVIQDSEYKSNFDKAVKQLLPSVKKENGTKQDK